MKANVLLLGLLCPGSVWQKWERGWNAFGPHHLSGPTHRVSWQAVKKKRSCSSDLATQHRCPPPCHSGWRISLTRLTRGRLQARQAPSCLHGKFSRDLIRPGVLWLYAECNLERSVITGLTSTIPSISAVEWEDKYILAWNFKILHPTLYTSCARFNGEEYN